MSDGNHSPRVLMVDDDEVYTQMLLTYLRLQGVAALAITDTSQAFEHLMHSPDSIRLVLVDLAMPGLNGFALAAALRCEPHLAHLPIVAVSARSSPEVEEAVAAAGIDRLLRKPFDLHSVRTLLTDFGLLPR